MQTVDYSLVEDTVKGLAGVDTLSTSEKAFVRSSFNRRCRMAFDETSFWMPFIESELRYSGMDNVIPYEQTGLNSIDTMLDVRTSDPRVVSQNSRRYESYNISDGIAIEGKDYADGYSIVQEYSVASGTLVPKKFATLVGTSQAVSFRLRYTGDLGANINYVELIGLNGLNSSNNIFWSSETDGGFGVSGVAVAALYVDGALQGTMEDSVEKEIDSVPIFSDQDWHDVVITVPQSGTDSFTLGNVYLPPSSTYNGDTGDKFEIADVRIYASKITASQAASLATYRDSIVGELLWASSLPQWYCVYKRTLTETYGDQTGDTSAVPIEFYQYGVHGAYADWLRGEGQTEKAFAEESFAQAELQRQLERIHRSNRSPYLWNRFNTHLNKQWR